MNNWLIENKLILQSYFEEQHTFWHLISDGPVYRQHSSQQILEKDHEMASILEGYRIL